MDDQKFDDELWEVADRMTNLITEKMGANLIEGDRRIDGVDQVMQRVSDLTHVMCRIRALAMAEEADAQVPENHAEIRL